MGRVPIPCKKCGTFLSGKARKKYDDESIPQDERGLCNGCLGIGYNPSPTAQSGRKYLFKKKK